MQTRVWSRLGLAVLGAVFLGAMCACGGGGGSNGEFVDLDHEVTPPAPGTFLGDASTDAEPPPPVEGCSPVTGPLLSIDTFERAIGVIGQDALNTGEANNGAGIGVGAVVPDGVDYLTVGVGTDATGAWVADAENNRVVRFPLPLSGMGPDADVVIGQTDLVSEAAGLSVGDLNYPVDVVRSGTHLIVSDNGNNRVLIFNPIPVVNGDISRVVLGQPDFESNGPSTTQRGLAGPGGVYVAGEKLFVVDSGNNRIMVWNQIPRINNAPADLVLGQPDFKSKTPRLSRNGLDNPIDVWSDGCRVVVTDQKNTRVMIWDKLPKTNGANADVVLGRPDFTSKYNLTTDMPATLDYSRPKILGPIGVDSNGTQLFVVDSVLNRVLVWSTFPTKNHQLPDRVLGQSDWLHNVNNDDDQDAAADGDPGGVGIPSARTFWRPTWVHIHRKQLFVTDGGNSRVLLFE